MARTGRQIRRGAALATATALACAGVALAAKPVDGGAYKGNFKGAATSGSEISFNVSANGKKVTDLFTETPFKCSGGCGGVPSGSGGSGKISKKGTFRVKITLYGLGGHTAEGTDTVTGTFLSHGRAKGTVTSKFKGGSAGETKRWIAAS